MESPESSNILQISIGSKMPSGSPSGVKHQTSLPSGAGGKDKRADQTLKLFQSYLKSHLDKGTDLRKINRLVHRAAPLFKDLTQINGLLQNSDLFKKQFQKISSLLTDSKASVNALGNIRVTKRQISAHLAKKFGPALGERICSEIFKGNNTFNEQLDSTIFI
jgi:hypothetical protein